jgi:hypothetical protein
MAAVADARVAEPLDDPPAAVARRVGEGVAQHERLATGRDPWAAPAAPAAPAAAGGARLWRWWRNRRGGKLWWWWRWVAQHRSQSWR